MQEKTSTNKQQELQKAVASSRPVGQAAGRGAATRPPAKTAGQAATRPAAGQSAGGGASKSRKIDGAKLIQ